MVATESKAPAFGKGKVKTKSIHSMLFKGRVYVRYKQKRAYFSKFRAIQRLNPPKHHVNVKFFGCEVAKKIQKRHYLRVSHAVSV